jgi:osmotically-inducible protein OsmY
MLDPGSIGQRVCDGVVILTGTVPYRADIEVAVGVIRHIPGVIDVVNRVTCEEPSLALSASRNSNRPSQP